MAHPIATLLVRLGVTANGITLTGLVLTCSAAVALFGNGLLVAGAIVIAACTLLDLLDGAVARAGDGGSPYGALVDAVSDRVADGVILASLIWWLVAAEPDNRFALGLLLACLVLSQVVSYSKARADAGGLRTPGGLMERADRLVLILLGTGLEGLGVPWALEVALTVVAVGSGITVLQRVWGGRADYLAGLARVDAPSEGQR
ncbi:CDP-alcohol phosphatidyltransferase family protein [Rhodococcus sp. IEGM 1408]|nr:CDP-alcohol phosphatidyltransferase family protein [Rhodococcus sp. IEGM 1408]MDV8000347.1 CDP-alcohol phosphatidyltransferase family protein [Rhodococcus sp. IEGM 1408]